MKILFAIIFIHLISIVGFSQSLSFKDKLHDFGTIYEVNGIVKHNFTVTNISDKPFIVNFITTGCGCTDAQYDKSPIMPNKSRDIVIQYNPANRAGGFRTAINIVGASPREDYTIHVTGTIVAQEKTIEQLYPISLGDVKLKEDFIPFGIIPNREIHTYFIELYNPTSKDISLSVLNDNTKNAKTWVTNSIVKSQQSSYIMYELNLKESDYLGDISDNITIFMNKKQSNDKISVSGTIIPNHYDISEQQRKEMPIAIISKIEHSINFSETNNSYNFKITNTGHGKLKILSAIKRSKNVDYSVNFDELEREESGTITLSLNKTNVKHNTNGVLTFITNSLDTPIFTLTLIGEKLIK